MKPSFMEFYVLRTAVDLCAAGIGPAVAVVEAQRAQVAVEDPETGVGEAVGDETVDSGGVQRSSDAPTPVVRIEVERVQVAQRGISAVGGHQGWAGRSEADDPPRRWSPHRSSVPLGR